MDIKKEKVLEALSTVYDPDLKKDLVSLNMISDITINGTKISFTLTLTTPACPLKDKLKRDCTEAIHSMVSESAEVEITLSSRVTQSSHRKEGSLPDVKNIIAVVSGKGGVGKSTVAANLALALAKSGARTALVDADIYGPSVPMMFGLKGHKPEIIEKDGVQMMVPAEKFGLKMLSIGFFVDPDKAVIWRGPMASSALKQLFTEADWGSLDYMIIDTPPGTGDIHLTMVQTLAVSGVVVVTTPQEVALADARKAVSMFRQEGINVPVLGLVENMSYFTPAELPENKYYIFGKGGGQKLADEFSIPLLGQIPVVQSICESGDAGRPVLMNENSAESAAFTHLAESVSQQVAIWNAMKEMTDVEKCKH
ncbi:MAG: Mrp/NBP35 family ATP-binding protein [Bacteroidota bacterium]